MNELAQTPHDSEDRLIRRFQVLLETFVDRTTVVVSGQSEDMAVIHAAVEEIRDDFQTFRADVLRQRATNGEIDTAHDAAIASMAARLESVEQALSGLTDYQAEAKAARREIVEGLRVLTREIRGEGM